MSEDVAFEAWLEGMSDYHVAFDDAWSRLFAMVLGTRTPDKEVRELFREFVTDWCMQTDGRLSATESDMIELFPDFLESLVERIGQEV